MDIRKIMEFVETNSGKISVFWGFFGLCFFKKIMEYVKFFCKCAYYIILYIPYDFILCKFYDRKIKNEFFKDKKQDCKKCGDYKITFVQDSGIVNFKCKTNKCQKYHHDNNFEVFFSEAIERIVKKRNSHRLPPFKIWIKK
jgi:hypothetical protein